MPWINAVTLVVAEPSVVAQRLSDAFGWRVTPDLGVFAELTTVSGALLWLNGPSEPTTALHEGVIVHCWVDHVTAATERARAAGAVILREPAAIDFGMESAWVRGDGGPIVDITRPI
jgi:predicted enzyme related to lactoylglutathione lyase